MDKPGRIDKASHHNFFWYDALHLEGGMQMKFVRNLFESRPVLSPERMPDQGLILSSNDSVDAHIQCARAMDHSFLIVYTTNGSEFTLDLSRMPGKTLNAWWLLTARIPGMNALTYHSSRNLSVNKK